MKEYKLKMHNIIDGSSEFETCTPSKYRNKAIKKENQN
jgi:hypothetical protein